jgi:amino acid transporter
MFPGAILGLLIIIASLLFVSKSTFFSHLDHFQTTTGGITSDKVVSTAQSLGFQSQSGTSWIDTFGMSVNFAYSFIWTMWSVELLGELKGANRVRSVFGMFSGSHILMFITYAVGIIWTYNYLGKNFVQSFSWLTLNHPDKLGGDWDFRGASTFFYIPTLNLLIGTILFLCFVGPISQSLFNTILGASRLMLASSFDRVLPSWLGRVNRKGVPYIAIWIGVALSVAVAIGFEISSSLFKLLFWSTFMTLLAMICSTVAATILPWRRKSIYEVSPASQYVWFGIPAITICGFIATAFLVALVIATATLDAFHLFSGSTALVAGITAAVVTVGSAVWFEVAKRYRRSQGLEISAAFQEIPPA